MSFYENRVLPHVINCVCGMKDVMRQREKIVPQASGNILEMGMGSGLNLPYYDKAQVTKIWGLEPSKGMQAKAAPAIANSDLPIEWMCASGEDIPLDDNSIDTVVLTYTLCTIPNGETALGEMRRVLKPEGKLLFCEHGAAPDPSVRKWQNRINPIWKKLAGGCNLNRPIDRMISASGFQINEIEQDYLPGPKFATYNYWGLAS